MATRTAATVVARTAARGVRALAVPAKASKTPAPLKQTAVWSEHQADRRAQMTGPRFLDADLSAQPLPLPAIDYIAAIPVIPVHGREAVCEGGTGALGHPRVYINLDKGENTCGYCGLRFKQDGSGHHH